jgi:hypothetical protein
MRIEPAQAVRRLGNDDRATVTNHLARKAVHVTTLGEREVLQDGVEQEHIDALRQPIAAAIRQGIESIAGHELDFAGACNPRLQILCACAGRRVEIDRHMAAEQAAQGERLHAEFAANLDDRRIPVVHTESLQQGPETVQAGCCAIEMERVHTGVAQWAIDRTKDLARAEIEIWTSEDRRRQGWRQLLDGAVIKRSRSFHETVRQLRRRLF